MSSSAPKYSSPVHARRTELSTRGQRQCLQTHYPWFLLSRLPDERFLERLSTRLRDRMRHHLCLHGSRMRRRDFRATQLSEWVRRQDPQEHGVQGRTLLRQRWHVERGPEPLVYLHVRKRVLGFFPVARRQLRDERRLHGPRRKRMQRGKSLILVRFTWCDSE